MPNLFVSDGGVLPSGTAARLDVTIEALAIRQADDLSEQLSQQVI